MESRWQKRYLFAGMMATLFALFLVAAFWQRIFYSIHTGQVGVLYRFFWGTYTERTYGEGLNVVFPWNTLFLYDVREQEQTEEVEVLSYNGLSIRVSFSFRFQPDAARVGLLHQKLGPTYVQKLVRPMMVATVREVIGNYRPEELFTTHSATLQEEIRQIAQREIAPYHIGITQILVKSVKLPAEVEKAIQEKLVLQQVAEGYDFRLVSEERERQRKQIESEGIRVYHETVARALTAPLLEFLHIQTLAGLVTSQNAKVVVLGEGRSAGTMFPLMLNDLDASPSRTSPGPAPKGSLHPDTTQTAEGLSEPPLLPPALSSLPADQAFALPHARPEIPASAPPPARQPKPLDVSSGSHGAMGGAGPSPHPTPARVGTRPPPGER
ncbi:MAG: SPFH domain-containing protein [Myxococcota bacterium]